MTLRQLPALLLALSLAAATVHGAEPTRIYFIGNSVTDTVRYDKFAELCAAQGHPITWGRHMIPGAPLEWLWSHQNDGFQKEAFGRSRKALTEFPWDVVTLQPFDRQTKEDVEVAKEMMTLAQAKNPKTQFYIYARWPRQEDSKKNKQVPFPDVWEKSYTGGWDGTNETRDYFTKLTAALNKLPERGPLPPVRIIPVGDVMASLHKQMQSGKIAGFKDITQIYYDAIHLNNIGSYLVALTFYSTIFNQSPVGLPIPEGYQQFSKEYGGGAKGYDYVANPPSPEGNPISPELAKAIQETVWQVVSHSAAQP